MADVDVDDTAHALITIDRALTRCGPEASPPRVFEDEYCLVCRVSDRGFISPCVLTHGNTDHVFVAYPRDATAWNEAQPVAARIQFAPASTTHWPRDAATMYYRQYFAPMYRLQPAVDRGAVNVERLIDCFLLRVPVATGPDNGVIRMITISELPLLSDDFREFATVPVPHDVLRPAAALPLLELPGAPPQLTLLDLSQPAVHADAAAGGVNTHALFTSLQPVLAASITPSLSSCTLRNHRCFGLPMHRFACKAVALQLLLALRSMHEVRMFFRGMSPSNVIVMDIVDIRISDRAVIPVPVVKLCGFGLLRPLEPDEVPVDPAAPAGIIASQIAGDPCYCAPELAAVRGQYDGRADVFSVGCIIFNLVSTAMPTNSQLHGFPDRFAAVPGRARSVDAAGHPVLEDVVALDTHFEVGTEARAWLEAATARDFTYRFHAEELIAHPWLKAARVALPSAMGDRFDAAGMEAALATPGRREVFGAAIPAAPVTEAMRARLEELHRRAHEAGLGVPSA